MTSLRHKSSFTLNEGCATPLGVAFLSNALNIAVLAPNAQAIYFCVFDHTDREVARIQLPNKNTSGVHYGAVCGIDIPADGLWYGLRADGEYAPKRGMFYDIHKLLIDPYAVKLSRPFEFDERLAAPASAQIDTAPLMPKAVFCMPLADDKPIEPASHIPQFIYELSVKAFTQRHPDVRPEWRGTVAALREPAVIAHLKRIGVDTVELMPVAAWINERHLHKLGLHNAWGYNPVAMMASDPRLCPNGWRELRETVAALKAEGIATILDVVFNHTGEGDIHGPTLSLRGLDNLYYYKHDANFNLINDTGCGNTLACEVEGVAQLMVDSMRHWVLQTGVAGFRFDLAPIMGRLPTGFSADAPLMQMIAADAVLSKCLLIAEPWDVGPGGYQLGQFPTPWLEWNDKYRDDVRRFWQGQNDATGGLATRLAGSSDVFNLPRTPQNNVNFIAAHDGFALRDVVSYSHKYNGNNGEQNRDGTNDNHSWSNGVEGELNEHASAEAIEFTRAARTRDVRALLATLFTSQGTPMLTAGDEFGRTQSGNNNAYAQDNDVTWLDWTNADDNLIEFTAQLAALRRDCDVFHFDGFLTEQTAHWWRADGQPMSVGDWYDGSKQIGLTLQRDGLALNSNAILLWFNASAFDLDLTLPAAADGFEWQKIMDSGNSSVKQNTLISARGVGIWRQLASSQIGVNESH